MTDEGVDYNDLAMGISRIERRHKRFMNRALAENGVTGVSYNCVIAVKRNPGVNQDRLAEIQGVDKSRVARMVRALELAGYVKRAPSPEDRRRYMLSLTPEGEDLFEMIMDISRNWAALIGRDIDYADIGIMTRTIHKIIQNLNDNR